MTPQPADAQAVSEINELLRLAATRVLSGDQLKAKTAHQDFLTLWKDADPDIPILKQAQAEYARIH